MINKQTLQMVPYKKLAVGGLVIVVLSLTISRWWPFVASLGRLNSERQSSNHSNNSQVAVKEHAHEHASPPHATLELSAQAQRSLGLTPDHLRPIVLRDFSRTVTIPAMVVAKPGRSQIVVSSPLSGVVTHVHAVPGEAVMPGELLFELRLTYEDLVETQTLYLQVLSELAVEQREIERLEQVTQSGAISARSLLDRRYSKEKLEAHLQSLREALRLHGLSTRQVDNIGREGKLLRDLQVVAPDIDAHEEGEELRLSQEGQSPMSLAKASLGKSPLDESQDQPDVHLPNATHPLLVEELQVHKGQGVTAGEKLCVLSDYSSLFIEGKAFEQDVPALVNAVEHGWSVDAVFPDRSGSTQISDLQLAYINSTVNSNSRTVSCYIHLPNEIVSDESNEAGQRFLHWKHRVGQRLELRVPVERWEKQIVVPVEAVAKDGAEWYVFRKDGAHFDRVAVNVMYRDRSSAVLANDGSIRPDSVIAMKSAHQMQLAMKLNTSSGIDPHAGHSH